MAAAAAVEEALGGVHRLEVGDGVEQGRQVQDSFGTSLKKLSSRGSTGGFGPR
jgi:hypothetical protein